MQLKIVVGSSFENIIYSLDKVDIGVKDGDIKTIEETLKDKDEMEECISTINLESDVILGNYLDDDILDDYLGTGEENKTNAAIDENNKTIELINEYKEKPLSIDDFDSYHITFGKDEDIFKYRNLLETIDKKITLDIRCLSSFEIMKLQDINFKVEPIVEHNYNRAEGVTLSEFIDTLNIINESKDAVLKYNFSNLEKLIFIYDKVRKRTYIKADNESSAHSRDLSKVLKEDAIVCEGYANILSAVANELGITTEVKLYYPVEGNIGHACNICYINDDKYGLKTCLEFDATIDSKKEDNSYVNSYRRFGMIISDRERSLASHLYSPRLTEEKSIIGNYDRYIEKKDPNDKIMNNVLRNGVLSHIRKMYNNMHMPADFIDFDGELFAQSSNITDEELLDQVNIISKMYNTPISASAFAKALYKVRRVEHSIDPDTYPMDMNSIKQAITSRYTDKERLMTSLFGKEPNYTKEISKTKELNNIPAKTPEAKIRYDEKRMRLLHALYKDLDDRTKEETIK